MGREELLPELNRSELDVMKVLWEGGRLSAREVHDRVAEAHGWAYSTTRTLLERMVSKGLLGKGSFHGIYLYEPRISRARGLAGLVRDFAQRVLELEPAPVVSLFAESGALEAEEIEELARLLEAREGER